MLHRSALLVLAAILQLTLMAPSQASAEIISVGAIVPLTRELSDYGKAIQAGFSLAQQDNANNFTCLKFVFEDSSYDGKKALTALNALKLQGISDFLYTWGVLPNQALLPVLAQSNIPTIAETSLRIAARGKPTILRAAPSGDETARVLAQEIVAKGHQRIGIVMVDIEYYHDILASLQRRLTGSGVVVEVIDTVPPDHNSFGSLVKRVQQKKYDLLGVFLLNAQIVSWYRDMQALRMNTATFGAGIHDSLSLLRDCGKAAENTFFAGVAIDETFRNRIAKLVGSDSRAGAAANAYDTAIMIAEGFDNCRQPGKISPVEALKRIVASPARRGASGAFRPQQSAEFGQEIEFTLALKRYAHGAIMTQ